MSEKKKEFTPRQLRALDVSQRHLDACLSAGPGSGKTTVLVEYFRRLVEEGVDPLRILAITFTEKAAGNMKKKLAEAFEESSRLRARMERAWVSTVHGFCSRLLRENAVFAGVDPQFYVADEREAWRMQQEAISKALADLFAEQPAAIRAFVHALPSGEFEEAVLNAYDAMRGDGTAVGQLAQFALPPAQATIGGLVNELERLGEAPLGGWDGKQRAHLDEIREWGARVTEAARAGNPEAELRAIASCPVNLKKCCTNNEAYAIVQRIKQETLGAVRTSLITELYAPQRGQLLEIVRRFDRLYRERKRLAGALDFADLEEYAVRLLGEHPDARERLQAQFDYVLMDEFQDTNGQQAKLLGLVRPKDRFYAVGDVNQSIFGFRHAEPAVFSGYRDTVRTTGGRSLDLLDNFRSRPQILSAVETLLYGAPGIEPRTLEARRAFKAEREVCVDVMAIRDAGAKDALAREARWVARRVLEFTREPERPFAFREIAVLVRNTEVLGAFTAAFEAARVPHVVNRGKGFYEAREVNDLINLLRVIANPRDEISLAAVLRSPLAGVSDEALLRLSLSRENLGSALALVDTRAGDGYEAEDCANLARFRSGLRRWRARREYVSFDRLLLDAMDDCSYRPEAGPRGAANVEKFLAQARAASGRMSLDEFVEELRLARKSDPREPNAPPDDSADAVALMTVHSAKGLEFPVVFVAALHKGISGSTPPVAFAPRIGLGAAWRDPGTGKSAGDLYLKAGQDERKKREEHESNRLLYVATTRAEEHLVLSFSRGTQTPRNWAAAVSDKLGLDSAAEFDGVLARRAPDGKEWKLRFLSTDAEPGPLLLPGVAEAAGGVLLLEPPQVEEQHDTDATVTALSLYASCPRRYWLHQYLGFEGRPASAGVTREEGLSPAEFGTQVHALLAGKAIPDPEPEALRLAEAFRESPLGRRSARAARVEREYDFLMSVEDLVIRGQIDLWFDDAGAPEIVDYKTDRLTVAEAHERATDYSLQLRLYAMAVERLTGRVPARAWLYFLRPNVAVEVDLAPSLLDSPAQIARDLQEAQSQLEFSLSEGAHCHRCPYVRDLCPAGAAPAAIRP